jgi:hypothetical protein
MNKELEYVINYMTKRYPNKSFNELYEYSLDFSKVYDKALTPPTEKEVMEALKRVKGYLEEIGISRFNIDTLQAIDDDIDLFEQTLLTTHKQQRELKELKNKVRRIINLSKLSEDDWFSKDDRMFNELKSELKQLVGEEDE